MTSSLGRKPGRPSTKSVQTADFGDPVDKIAPLTIRGKEIRNIYLSGKITGETDFGVSLFSQAEKHLRDCGFDEVFNPTKSFDGDTSRPRGDYMSIDLDYVINSADAVAVLGNWKLSKGARTEVLVALECGKPVITADTLEELDHIEVITNAVDNSEPVSDEALRLVYGIRNDSYGHPLNDFNRSSLIWSGILLPKLQEGQQITPEDVALCMIGVKLSRQVNRPTRDNLVDTVGYALCYQKIQTRRAELAALSGTKSYGTST